uniref:Uncharacterized protein n=1 Tax=Sphaerodactylus townsendi TaxID=933632 RepID=A0ACB8F817_9SAUR
MDRDLDPAKVCAGKGAVTLRASLTYEENPSTSPSCPPVIQQSESDWRLSPNADPHEDAPPSALASKGYRSVRPNIPSESKPQVKWSPITTTSASQKGCINCSKARESI